MTRTLLYRLGFTAAALALALPAYAQVQDSPRNAAQATRELRGRIVRTAPDQFIVETPDNRQVTVYTNPQTRYVSNNQVIPYSDLRQGVQITTTYTTQGERFIANAVTLVPANANPPAQPAPNPPQTAPAQPAPPAGPPTVEGEVVRVIGQDHVVIRTSDGKEVIVHVNPQTQYQFTGQPAAFTTLQPGYPVGVYYDVQGGRNVGRRFIGLRRNR